MKAKKVVLNYAVENVGRDVLIIRNNQVIGKGMSQIMRGLDFVSITLVDDDAKKLIPVERISDAIGYKHTYLRYDPISGMFLEIYGNDPEWEDINDRLEDTLVVDEFNFRWGLCPDTFKDVPGYRSAMIEAYRKDTPW